MSRSFAIGLGAVALGVLALLAMRAASPGAARAEPEPLSDAPVAATVSVVSAPDSMSTLAAPGSAAPNPVPSAQLPSEAVMMDQLRGTLGKGTPQATLELARQLEQTYPDGAQAQGRSLYAIDALIALNRISEMRDEARRHLAKWPGTAISERVEARTGVHPEIHPPN
jgi:hypothetical protein